MAKKRKNGEGTWGTKIIKGVKYKYYRDPFGKYFYGKTEKEINQKREKYDADKISDSTTFGTFLLWYYNNVHKNSVEKSTHAEYIRVCNIIINSPYYKIGDIQLCSFSKENNYIREYIQAVTPYYSLNTLKGQISKIKVAVKYAEKTGRIEKGLLEDIKYPKEANVGSKAKKIPFLTKDIADKIYEHIYDKYYNGSPKYGYYYWVMLLIMHTGLRMEELRAVRLNDINFEEKTLRIDEAIVKIKREDGQYEYITKVTKNPQSNRVVPLNSIAIEMLQNIINFNKPKKKSDLICYNKDGYLKNTRLAVASDRILRDVESPIKHCNPHALRHTFGSMLYEQGVKLKTISKLLGHSSITTTANIYIGLTQKHLDDSVTVLEPSNK